MKRLTLLLYLSLVSSIPVTAQTQKIARLLQQETAAADPRKRLAIELSLLEEHESIFKDSLQPVALRTLGLARQLNDLSSIGYARLGLINAYLRNDQPRVADSLINISLADYSLSDPQQADIQLRLRMARTGLLAAKADYEAAVKDLLAIIRDAEKTDNYALLSRAFNELGVISYNRNELPRATEYYNKALSYQDRNPKADLARAYSCINLAQVYAWQESYDTALAYLNEAKPICERLENLYYLANAYVVEASIYKWSGRLGQAEAAMLQMVKLREKTEGNLTFSNEQLALANFYVYASDYSKALNTYREGLLNHKASRAAGVPANYELLLRYYEGMAKAYLSTGSRDEYETSLREIIALKDSLTAKSSSEAITEMQTKYEVQKKENTIIAQKLDITRKNFLFYGSMILSALAAVIGWLLFRAYRRKSRMQLEEEKRHATQAVREAEETERKRIAADLHDSLGSYAASIKSNADEMKRSQQQPMPALDLLQNNAQQMVSLLADTIWAMRKERLRLSDISDRIKVVLQRLRPSYPAFQLRVEEDLDDDTELPPVHAYHLFMIIQEAVNNALRHSDGSQITISFKGGGAWQVCIRDNGIGMKVPESTEGGNGMHTMQERAAAMNCSITWHTHQGTEICLQPTSN